MQYPQMPIVDLVGSDQIRMVLTIILIMIMLAVIDARGGNVFICICNGITENQIRDAVCSGVDDLAQLRGCLGVGAGCGTCAGFAEQIISETLQTNGLPENRAAA